jgi:superfamily I DNA/RNA helicase/DNA polymerase III epsilon subunit-like protein
MSVSFLAPSLPALIPSASQREAIEAKAGPLLVLAGPGAGKTFCLIERIGFLVERLDVDPARICAFTFTNKAAGEISHRLEARLGEAASRIKRGTIHSFCAELLREFGPLVELAPGFGIADEDYQINILRRFKVKPEWCRSTLTRFSAHRFRNAPLHHNDVKLLADYEAFLRRQRVVDYDHLVLKAAELLERREETQAVRSRWDVVLVDEFQDLNPVQYRVVAALAKEHRHIFAVGDDEQSIYSWAGADPEVFRSFSNDFQINKPVHLGENRRCPQDVFALARKLVMINTPIFADKIAPQANRLSQFPIEVKTFGSDEEERSWIVDDIIRDRMQSGHRWGDVALLYRTNEMGNWLESAFLNKGIPCRLAQGRALSEDPVVAYVIGALRVIANPNDVVYRDEFLSIILPRPLFDEARVQAQAANHELVRYLEHKAKRLPKADDTGRHIRRALTDLRNLRALGARHERLVPLVQELLSRRVGRLRSILDERHEDITDAASWPEVVTLANRLRAARDESRTIWMPRLGGVGIALKGMLVNVGFTRVECSELPPPGAECIDEHDTPSVGIALGVFKALQLIEVSQLDSRFRDFTAVDLETTEKDVTKAEIIEVAAVRVRDGQIVERFSTLVKPKGRIPAASTAVHNIRDADVATASPIEMVWPKFRAFCGNDVVVAHNGYDFDFPVLARVSKQLGKRFDLYTYDTLPLARDLYPTSAKLVDLARQFGIDPGRSHRALDDTVALAKVFLALDEVKLSRARKTALVNVLDHLGVALALSEESKLGPEALFFRDVSRVFALGKYSSCLEFYEREQNGDDTLPSADEVIDALGGVEKMLRIRTDKSADERYPSAMLRLRRLIAEIPDEPLQSQLTTFLERAVLSRWDGNEAEDARVNLLTLHSTKGLEFSRVYVVGVEDTQLPGGSPTNGPKPTEVEEARRLLYVGMTRTKDRLVLTRVENRAGKPTRGHQFLDEMGLMPKMPEIIS